jgi:hypothetical protein
MLQAELNEQSLMNVYKKTDIKGQAYEVSHGNEDSIKNWTRGHLSYVLLKN